MPRSRPTQTGLHESDFLFSFEIEQWDRKQSGRIWEEFWGTNILKILYEVLKE